MGIKERRSDFPLLMSHPELIYLDSAATTQKPMAVIEAMNCFYKESYGTVHRGAYSLSLMATEKYFQVREKVKSFLHAKEEGEILFTRGSTASLNLVARSLTSSFLSQGDLILISAIEHHSNVVPWQMAAESMGLRLKAIPVNKEGDLIWDEYLKLLKEGAKIVSIAHIANSIGTHHPVERVIEEAKKQGAMVVIDGAQGASHVAVDVKEMDADFYLFSGHKLYGPTGIGVLYGKMEHLLRMKPVEGGGDMIERVNLEKSSYALPPLKFEAGTPMIVEAIGLGAAIDYISSVGMEEIVSHEAELTRLALKLLEEMPEVILIGKPKKRGAIISFLVDGVHPYDLALMLDAKGVALRSGHHCSQITMDHFGISGTLRISFGLYNTVEEVERFIDALKKSIVQLRQ